MLLLGLCPNAAPAQEPLSWPNRAPFVRVDGVDEFVLVPKDVVRVAQRHLKDKPPREWGMVSGTSQYAGRSLRVVELFVDELEVEVSFLVTPQSWNLLNEQNVTCLNEVLDEKGRDLVASGFDDWERRTTYLGILDRFTIGVSIALDEEFIGHYFSGGGRSLWLEGQEKSADALLRYCHDVFVTRQDGQVTFTYNAMLRNGGVVQRAVHARVVGPRLEFLRAETIELRPKGTFSYPD